MNLGLLKRKQLSLNASLIRNDSQNAFSQYNPLNIYYKTIIKINEVR